MKGYEKVIRLVRCGEGGLWPTSTQSPHVKENAARRREAEIYIGTVGKKNWNLCWHQVAQLRVVSVACDGWAAGWGRSGSAGEERMLETRSGMGCAALCPPGRTAQDCFLTSVYKAFPSEKMLLTSGFLAISILNVHILRYPPVIAEQMPSAEIKHIFLLIYICSLRCDINTNRVYLISEPWNK